MRSHRYQLIVEIIECTRRVRKLDIPDQSVINIATWAELKCSGNDKKLIDYLNEELKAYEKPVSSHG